MKNQLSFLFLLCVAAVFGQNGTILNSGVLRAEFGPGGALQAPNGGNFLSMQAEDQYESLVFEAGLLTAGLNPDNSIELHSIRGASNVTGIYGNTDLANDHWRITRAEIEAHQADFEDNGVIDNPIAAVFAWPGRENPSFFEYNDYELNPPGRYVADFWDADLDGIYEPAEGEYPTLFIRGCAEVALVPAEMIFFPFMSTQENGVGPNLQVFLTAYRFDCQEEDAAVSNSIYLHYRIIRLLESNSSDGIMNTHFGFIVDGDIGCPSDDYVGTFPQRSVAYFYNANATDGNCKGQEGYGDNPPALAVDVFRGPLDEMANETGITSSLPFYNSNLGNFPVGTGLYNTTLEAYNNLQGNWRDGSPLLNQGIGYNNDGTAVNFAFDGDPLTGEGWTEAAANNPLGDRMMLLSTPGFSYYPGSLNEFIVALTPSYVPDVSNLEQVSRLRERVDLVQTFYDGCMAIDEFSAEFAGCSPVMTNTVEHQLPISLLALYPNPAEDLITLQLATSAGSQLQVFNASGQLVQRLRLRGSQPSVDISQWSSGVYFLRWQGDGEVRSQKVVVE